MTRVLVFFWPGAPDSRKEACWGSGHASYNVGERWQVSLRHVGNCDEIHKDI